MKQSELNTAALKAAITKLRADVAAVKDNQQAIASEKQTQSNNLDAISLDDLEKQEAALLEESKRAMRLRVRETAAARLVAAVAESTKALYGEFLELAAEVNETVGVEKHGFRAAFQDFIAPLAPHYGGPLDESILWRLSAPYERLLDSVQNLDNISRENERDPMLRAEFYLRRSEMLAQMVLRFETAGGKWFVAAK